MLTKIKQTKRKCDSKYEFKQDRAVRYSTVRPMQNNLDLGKSVGRCVALINVCIFSHTSVTDQLRTSESININLKLE